MADKNLRPDPHSIYDEAAQEAMGVDPIASSTQTTEKAKMAADESPRDSQESSAKRHGSNAGPNDLKLLGLADEVGRSLSQDVAT